jgi:hypothetical protein
MRRRLLTLLRVPEHPQPPPGSEDGLLTFRASRRYLYYSALPWLFKQLSALAGLLFSLALLGKIDLPFFSIHGGAELGQTLSELQQETGLFWIPWIRLVDALEAFAIVSFAVQFVVSGLFLKLSWELRWYLVGEECLRIREGLWRLTEQTMTISKIQNMTVRQGPLQKLFGIEDLEIHTAGGGASSKKSGHGGEDQGVHQGVFRGIEDATALRNRIQTQLASFRGAGLGGHEEDQRPAESRGRVTEGALAAARNLLTEARLLKEAVTETLPPS